MIEVGTEVECRIPGKRVFRSTVVRVRQFEAGDQGVPAPEVDVKDPRNGGLRTLPAHRVTEVKGRRRGA